jgi:hypothetical protein
VEASNDSHFENNDVDTSNWWYTFEMLLDDFCRNGERAERLWRSGVLGHFYAAGNGQANFST